MLISNHDCWSCAKLSGLAFFETQCTGRYCLALSAGTSARIPLPGHVCVTVENDGASIDSGW